MNTSFGYNQGSIKNFKCLRSVCIWAGCISAVQALTWIALTMTGILAYNCVITIEGSFDYSRIVEIMFLTLYFQGSCPDDDTPPYHVFLKDKILKSQDLLIWNSVYMAVAVCWLISSCLMVAYVKNDNRRRTIGVILTWVLITFFICAMDLSLGIIFGIDYGNFSEEARLNKVVANALQIMAAMTISISMMIIAFKGFILWIVNMTFMVYLLVRAILILIENESGENLFMAHKESDDILATRPPINAYEEQTTKPEIISTVFTNEAYIPDNTPSDNTPYINQDLINRAARISMDASLQERRFRNLDNFQQYPPRQRPESSIPDRSPTGNSSSGATEFPVPDYTPPMQRAAQNRNQRYQ